MQKIRTVLIDPDSIPDVLGTVDQRIEKAAESRNVAVLCTVLQQLWTREQDLQWFEKKLRKLNTEIYMLVAPASIYPPHYAAMDLCTETTKEHFLWFAVNGKKEAEKFLEDFGLAKTFEENFELLADTGCAIVT